MILGRAARNRAYNSVTFRCEPPKRTILSDAGASAFTEEGDMSQSLGSTSHLPIASTRPTPVAWQVVAAIGMAGIALIHLIDVPSKFSETPYQGWLFVILIITSLVLADRLLRTDDRRVWMLAGIVAFSTLVAFVISRNVGNWQEPLAMASLFVEGMVVWLVALRLRNRT
jgi:hypothetical protein